MWEWYKNVEKRIINFFYPGVGTTIFGGASSVDVSGQYGNSPVVTTQGATGWFGKTIKTLGTILLIIVFCVLLLIVFKGYRFVKNLLKF